MWASCILHQLSFKCFLQMGWRQGRPLKLDLTPHSLVPLLQVALKIYELTHRTQMGTLKLEVP